MCLHEQKKEERTGRRVQFAAEQTKPGHCSTSIYPREVSRLALRLTLTKEKKRREQKKEKFFSVPRFTINEERALSTRRFIGTLTDASILCLPWSVLSIFFFLVRRVEGGNEQFQCQQLVIEGVGGTELDRRRC